MAIGTIAEFGYRGTNPDQYHALMESNEPLERTDYKELTTQFISCKRFFQNITNYLIGTPNQN